MKREILKQLQENLDNITAAPLDKIVPAAMKQLFFIERSMPTVKGKSKTAKVNALKVGFQTLIRNTTEQMTLIPLNIEIHKLQNTDKELINQQPRSIRAGSRTYTPVDQSQLLDEEASIALTTDNTSNNSKISQMPTTLSSKNMLCKQANKVIAMKKNTSLYLRKLSAYIENQIILSCLQLENATEAYTSSQTYKALDELFSHINKTMKVATAPAYIEIYQQKLRALTDVELNESHELALSVLLDSINAMLLDDELNTASHITTELESLKHEIETKKQQDAKYLSPSSRKLTFGLNESALMARTHSATKTPSDIGYVANKGSVFIKYNTFNQGGILKKAASSKRKATDEIENNTNKTVKIGNSIFSSPQQLAKDENQTTADINSRPSA